MSTAAFYADPNKISDANTVYDTSLTGFDISEFKTEEDWTGRPASDWSWNAINVLQAKIENFEKNLYHSRTIGKRKVHEFIPLNKLISFCNESFGYNGWSTEVVHIHSNKVEKPVPMDEQLKLQKELETKKLSKNNIKNDEDVEQVIKENKENSESENTKTADLSVRYQVVTEARVKITLQDGTKVCSFGFAQHTSYSLVRSLERSKKESVNKSLKNAILSFDEVIADFENKVKNNFYQDGLYGSSTYKRI